MNDSGLMQSSDGIIWRVEDRPCPTCGSRRTRTFGARGGRAHRGGQGVETNVVQCLECQIIYTKPTLIPETNLYAKEAPEEYFHSHDSQQKVQSGEAIAAFAEETLNRKGRMLELGCGRGELLLGAANRGWAVQGVEMTESFFQVATAKGISVECTSIQKSKSLRQEQAYEVILLAAILEHLYDPLETLKLAYKALQPGGLVFIDVPNELSLTMRVGNWYMRARGRDWAVNLSPTFSPFHVVGFSPASLKRVLTSTGFRVYRLDLPKWSNALPKGKNIMQRIERVALGTVQSVGARIGMGDGITCWAIRE